MNNITELNNIERENALLQYCPRDWEFELKNEIDIFRQTQSQFRLNLCLTYVRGESLHNIQYSTEYVQFGRDLRTNSKRIRNILSQIFDNNK